MIGGLNVCHRAKSQAVTICVSAGMEKVMEFLPSIVPFFFRADQVTLKVNKMSVKAVEDTLGEND